jgi:peptidoglycan/LPS O-acetylase OafA/YrhL
MNFEISLLSFIVCIFTGSLLTKWKSFAFLKERNARFETIDGLRGFLAISVFFHHFAGTYYWKTNGIWQSPPEDYYRNYGKVGVGIFFMITGFLFISKIRYSKTNNWLKIYESRIFRILPLYIFALILITIIVFHNSDYQFISNSSEIIKEYIRWGLFQGKTINHYSDTTLIIAGVDWTLKYEWLFYFSLPFIDFALKKGNKYTTILLLFLVLFLYFYPKTFLVYPAAEFSTDLFILFAIGGGTSYLSHIKSIRPELINSKTTSLLSLTLIIGCIFYPNTLDIFHIIIISSFFIITVLGNDLFGLFRLDSAKLLGEISYSIYLLHGLILYVFFTQLSLVEFSSITLEMYSILMPAVSIIVIILSAVTFIHVEKRFIKLGRKYLFTSLIYSLFGYFKKTFPGTDR